MATTKRKRPAAGRREAAPVSDFDVAARIGNDDAAVAAAGVEVRVADGGAFLVPVKLRSASVAQLEMVHMAQDLVREHMAALAALDRLVPLMRDSGLSWDSIGWCVGISGAGARKRWGNV